MRIAALKSVALPCVAQLRKEMQMIEQAASTLAVAPTRQSFSARGTLQLMYPPREAAGQRGL